MNSQQQQLLQGLGVDPAQIQALQAQAMAARAQQGQQGPGMNAQQQQILQGLGINPAQIQAIQAQAMAARAQQGYSGQPTGDYSASGYSTSAQPQPINLTVNRDVSGGMNISGLEGLTFVQAPTGMYEDGRGGGTIKISSSFKDVHGRTRPPDIVYTPFLIVFRDGARLGFVPERNTFAVNGMNQNSSFGSGEGRLISFPRRPVRPIQCPRGMTSRGISASASFPLSTSSKPSAPPEPPKVVYRPMTETGFMTKLGWKKTLLGGDSWQKRFFSLSEYHLTYSPKEFDNESKRHHIELSKRCQVQVVSRWHNALANRTRVGEWDLIGCPVGFDNCVELQCPDVGRFGRTYYMIAESPREAQRWCDAIQNNINALPEEAMAPSNNNPFGGGIFSSGFMKNAFASLDGAMTLISRQDDLVDPYKSFEFMKSCVETTLPDDEFAFELSQFFDRLEDGLR